MITLACRRLRESCCECGGDGVLDDGGVDILGQREESAPLGPAAKPLVLIRCVMGRGLGKGTSPRQGNLQPALAPPLRCVGT